MDFSHHGVESFKFFRGGTLYLELKLSKMKFLMLILKKTNF